MKPPSFGELPMTRRSIYLTITLMLGVSCLGVWLAQSGRAADAVPKTAREFAGQNVEVAKSALTMAVKLQQQGEADPSMVSTWSRRLVESLRKRGGPQRELTDALESHVALMEKNFKSVREAYRANEASSLAVADAEYALLEAKSSLAEARGAK